MRLQAWQSLPLLHLGPKYAKCNVANTECRTAAETLAFAVQYGFSPTALPGGE
jgi:hypothetical protein